MPVIINEAYITLGLAPGTPRGEVAKQFKKLSKSTHPDRFRGQPEYGEKKAKYQAISEAYNAITQSDESALALTDDKKPTISEFFLTLNSRLHRLSNIIKYLEPNNTIIEKFEGISIEQQEKNKKYLLSCISAVGRIAFLLQEHIKTSSTEYWKIRESKREMNLANALQKQFKKFGEDEILQVCDAGTVWLVQILLDHLFFLRHPLSNFKSTEDLYHLTLLEDVIPSINRLFDDLQERVKTIDANSTNDRAAWAALIDQNLSEIKEQINEPEEALPYNQLVTIKNNIIEAKQYVLYHCHYPNNIAVYNNLSLDNQVDQLDVRNNYIQRVINMILLFNNYTLQQEYHNELSFSVEESGLKDQDECAANTSAILNESREQGLASQRINTQFLLAQGIPLNRHQEFYLAVEKPVQVEKSEKKQEKEKGKELAEEGNKNNPDNRGITTPSFAQQTAAETENNVAEIEKNTAITTGMHDWSNALINKTLFAMNEVIFKTQEPDIQQALTKLRDQERAALAIDIELSNRVKSLAIDIELSNRVKSLNSRLISSLIAADDDKKVKLLKIYHANIENNVTCDCSVSQALYMFNKAIEQMQQGGFKQSLERLQTEMDNKQQSKKLSREEKSAMIQQISRTVRLASVVIDQKVDVEDRIETINTFHKESKSSAITWKNFGKAIAVVAIAALTTVVGAAIGAAIGIAAGYWTGPGVAMTALAGLIKGGYTGATLGVTSGASFLGLSVGGLGSYLFFKSTPQQKAIKKVAKEAKNFVPIQG